MRLVTARIVEVVMSDVVELVPTLVGEVGSPPDTTPGHCIWPADAEIARVNVRIATAHLLNKVFTFGFLLRRDAKILHCKLEHCLIFLARAGATA